MLFGECLKPKGVLHKEEPRISLVLRALRYLREARFCSCRARADLPGRPMEERSDEEVSCEAKYSLLLHYLSFAAFKLCNW